MVVSTSIINGTLKRVTSVPNCLRISALNLQIQNVTVYAVGEVKEAPCAHTVLFEASVVLLWLPASVLLLWQPASVVLLWLPASVLLLWLPASVVLLWLPASVVLLWLLASRINNPRCVVILYILLSRTGKSESVLSAIE